MKVFLLILIFAFFIIFAFYIYSKYLLRVQVFEDMIYLTKYFRNSISYMKDDLNILLNNSYPNLHSVTRKYLVDKNNNKSFLNIGDRELINKYFDSLGHGDVCFEVNNLCYYENIFLERLNFHRENKKNGSLYLKLIIGLGVLVVIILI